MSTQPSLDGLIVTLPTAFLDDYVGAIEVMLQEGLTCFALPASAEALGEVVEIFGARAHLGVTRVTTAHEVNRAAEAGARYALADVTVAAVAEAAAESGVECYGSAMTLTEVRAVLDRAYTGALLYPADVTGYAMAAHLADLALIDRVVAMGGVGAYAAGEWLDAGARAVCVGEMLVGDAFSGGSLSQLRDRCGSFVAVDRRRGITR